MLICIPLVPRARQPPFPASRGCQSGGYQRNQRPPGIHRQAADNQTNDGMAQKVEYHPPKSPYDRSSHRFGSLNKSIDPRNPIAAKPGF